MKTVTKQSFDIVLATAIHVECNNNTFYWAIVYCMEKYLVFYINLLAIIYWPALHNKHFIQAYFTLII